jgi:nucleotide-binding universal stress UspA family protein
MKRILVPTDFSDCAGVAVDMAMQLAKKAKAEVHFLHTMYTPVEWVKLPLEKELQYPEIKASIGHAKDELNKLEKRADKLGVKASSFLVFDSGREEIEKHAKPAKYDLLVMGSHGVKGVKEIVGSNTQKVLRYSKVPVLVVKGKTKSFEFKTLLFASDFSAESHKSFKSVLSFAAFLGAKIHLLYVNVPHMFKETQEIDQLMAAFVKKYPKVKLNVATYNAYSEDRGIRRYAEVIGADFIALGTHGKSGFTQLFTPSIAETVANHATKSVLSVRLTD